MPVEVELIIRVPLFDVGDVTEDTIKLSKSGSESFDSTSIFSSVEFWNDKTESSSAIGGEFDNNPIPPGSDITPSAIPSASPSPPSVIVSVKILSPSSSPSNDVASTHNPPITFQY